MSVFALVEGKLFKAPEQRASRNGNSFTTATIKVSSGNESNFWRIFVFSESAQAELMRLHDGDALAVQGTPKFEIYTPEGGQPRVSLSLTADRVLALRQPPRSRTKKEAVSSTPAASPAQRAPDRDGFKSRCGAASPDLDDSIPF